MKTIRETLNRFAAITGIVVVSDRLPRARNLRRESVLDLPGYRQVEDFSCGFVAALMVLAYLDAAPPVDRLYRLVGPHPTWGTSTRRLATALRRCRVRVGLRDDLDFQGMSDAIALRRPIITCVSGPHAEESHWCVVFGTAVRPRRVFVAGVGLPHLHAGKVVTWRDFRSSWAPPGNGLVCWKRG